MAIVTNPIFTILVLESPESQFYRLSLVRSSTTPVETVANLAQLPDEEILCAIAQNPNTLIPTLEQLVLHPPQIYDYDDPEGTEFARLFGCIAKNPNTPESLLIQLAEHSGGVQYAIAQNPKTPVAILEKFANWRNFTMHKAIVQNPNASTAVLEKLAGEQAEEIRNLVKAHPNASQMAIAIVEFMEDKPGTPIDLLTKLATHSSHCVRLLVADHPHTPSHALELLSLDDEYIVFKVAEHPNASAATLEHVAKWLATKHQQVSSPSSEHDYKSRYKRIVEALTEHPNITVEVIEMLFIMAEINILLGIARLATTPPNILLKLTKYEDRFPDYHLLQNLVNNPNTPAEALEILFSRLKKLQKPEAMDFRIARHPNTPVQILEELAKHPHLHTHLGCNPNTPVQLLEEFAMHLDLRTSVGRNPITPVELLRQLANDSKNDSIVLEVIAWNQNTPVDVLLRFVANSHFTVRRGLAGNTKAPVSILETLADDENEFVRLVLARNPSVPVSILERLATDADERVRLNVIENPKTPTQLLAMFVDLQDQKMRYGVAQHPNTSIDSLIRLAADPDAGVRDIIIKRPDLSEVVLEKLAETSFVQALVQNADGYNEVLMLGEIGKHPQTPIHSLEMMATNQPVSLYQRHGDSLSWLRYVVANNVNTPICMIEKLAEDRDSKVKAAAKKMLKARYQLPFNS